MSRRLRILPEAEEEIASAAGWYDAKRPGLGAGLVAEVDAALERIAWNPERCPLWRADRPYRRYVLRRFPYLIFYTVESESVLIHAVAHSKRRPGYWTDR